MDWINLMLEKETPLKHEQGDLNRQQTESKLSMTLVHSSDDPIASELMTPIIDTSPIEPRERCCNYQHM